MVTRAKKKSKERDIIDDITKEIKKKKVLSSLSDDFVKRLLLEFFKEYPQIRTNLEAHPKFLKSKDYKFLLKDIRKNLHDIYGVFILDKKDLSSLKEHMKEVKKIDNEALELHREILLTHKSSAERLNDYSFIYEKIFSITGKPKNILDLACGLNPLSFPWMNLKKVYYYASELTFEDSKFIQDYFDLMKGYTDLEGKAFAMDLLNLKKLPEVDICFLLKTLDSLEDLERNYSETLLKKIPAKFIVVSFPTMSIGGKNTIKQRGWFFRMMRNLNYSAETFEIENELFYIIKK